MALQGRANGSLAGVMGDGIFSATVSFLIGLLVLVIVCPFSPHARRGVRRGASLIASGAFPRWMTLGGIAGASVVVAQSITVPLIGVATFTMAFLSGQLSGALVVDRTRLPPGGPVPLSTRRIVGVVIVLASVIGASVGAREGDIVWWAPILPFAAGALTAWQQAFNGRFRMRTESALTASLLNFLVGSVALVIASAIVLGLGTPVLGLPELPRQSWMLLGGVLGVAFIGITTVTVSRLGVLVVSVTSLLGNLIGSLVVDLALPLAPAPVTWLTLASMVGVLIGVLITTLPGRRPPGGEREVVAEQR